MNETVLLPLDLPAEASRSERAGYRRLCRVLSTADAATMRRDEIVTSSEIANLYDLPILAAATHTAIDLVHQGWTVLLDRQGPLFQPPDVELDRVAEKERIRRQELVRRDQQLQSASVRRFVRDMERRRIFRGRPVSIFDLMRDGRDLLRALDEQTDHADVPAVAPYIQVADDSSCEHTGLRLLDVWRYFRHTWSNAYSSVPGRTMPLLIRDAAAPNHPVIGLAALASPIVQIAERDNWIGWNTDVFLADAVAKPSLKAARWISRRLTAQVKGIHVADLLADGIIKPEDLRSPTPEALARLRADAERYRRRHHRYGKIRKVRAISADAWVERAETDLFRSKRSSALAEALEILAGLEPYFRPRPSLAGLKRALEDPQARPLLRRLVRRARGERVGTVVADLSVCGAIPPYNALAAGKLVGALAVSPSVVSAYRSRYQRPSEIASAMAGRPVTRDSRLAFIATTSLYGTGSSQYNRLFWPAEVMGGKEGERMGFHPIGRSRSFGTSHFSDESVSALVRVAELQRSRVRVNSLFGEGVSPRLRKVRIGLAALGWPAHELLQHGRFRLVYGVPLVRNLRDFALGLDEPEYLVDLSRDDAGAEVASWWLQRWALPRSKQSAVRKAVKSHRLTRPIRHGARVPLPPLAEGDAEGTLEFG